MTTRHDGSSYGMQVNLVPHAAHVLFREPMHALARRTVPLEDVLAEPALVERLYDAGSWQARFALLDGVLAGRLTDAPAPSAGVAWAWQRIVQTGGRVLIASLAEELGWSRKRIVRRFREDVGLTPKAAARIVRFDRARALAERTSRPDWAWIAAECGYYDQPHLVNEFRSVTGRSPATFFQDVVAGAD